MQVQVNEQKKMSRGRVRRGEQGGEWAGADEVMQRSQYVQQRLVGEM